MKKLLVQFWLTLIIFIGSVGVSVSCYFQKGTAGLKSGDYVAVIRECESRGIQEDADSWESIKR